MRQKYIPAFLCVLLLVFAAFFAPAALFAVRDEKSCREISTGKWETADIASFGMDYETGLYNRMSRYAAELAQGKQIYVTERSSSKEEAAAFLQSGELLYKNGLWVLIDSGLLPADVQDYEILAAKQYVLYGEDFENGVDFILWYFELAPDGWEKGLPAVKLAADVKTGEIYAAKADCRLLEWYGEEDRKQSAESLRESIGIYEEDMPELGAFFSYWFGGIKISGYEELYEEVEYYDISIGADAVINENRQTTGTEETVGMQWEIRDEGNELLFQLPYQGSFLKFCMRLESGPENTPAVVIGFPELFERLPGFNE